MSKTLAFSSKEPDLTVRIFWVSSTARGQEYLNNIEGKGIEYRVVC